MAGFAERLRTLRQQAGLSQVELAGEDLSPSYISRLEAGTRTPSGDVLHQLAARLGCSVSQLADGRPSEREQRLELELAYGRLAVEHGESRDALVRMDQLLTEPDLPPPIRDQAQYLLARACERQSEHERAVSALQALYARCRQGLAHVPVISVAILLCHCYRAVGDLHRATAIGEQALETARTQGLDGTDDYFELAATVMHAYTELGDFLYARTLGQRLIDEAEESGQVVGQAALYWNAAILAEYEGRLADALTFTDRAMARMGELESTRDFARLRLAVAGILMACDPPETSQAAAMLRRCEADLSDLGSAVDLAEWAYVRSAVHLCEGEAAAAEDQARAALHLLGELAGSERVRALVALADAMVAQGRQAEAIEQLGEAADRLETMGSGRVIGLLWRELAERLADVGDLDAATPCYRRALEHGGIRDRSVAMRRVALNYSRHHVASVAGLRPPSEGPAETP